MAISKIIYKENAEATPVVWMDTTDKTADSGNMLNGITALKNDGTTATGNIQSQAAQTIYPSTSDQTIASGKYLAGAQTIKGVLLTNLDAGNIKKDVVVKVGDSADDDRITSVTGTYEGSGGGTVAEEKDVNFIDYDGTILYSYTKAEFASLSAMPANPSHTGLTAQGWNWSLSDAKTYVASYGKLWIGQMYITSSNDTEIDIELTEGRLSPYLGIAVNGTVDVDWGDGSTHSTVTGSSLTTQIRTLHNYSVAGKYTIAISVTNGSFAFYGTDTYFVLSKNSSVARENYVYADAVYAVRIGSNCSIGNYAFTRCAYLQSVTMPHGLLNMGLSAFQYCYKLKCFIYPDTCTSLPSSMAGSCILYNMYLFLKV